MNVRRAFTFVFADRRWAAKLGIAILLSVVPALLAGYSALGNVPGFAAPAIFDSPLFAPVSSIAFIPLNGFLLRITRDVVAGFDVPLPEWSDVRGILGDGTRLWALITVWSLPELAIRLVAGDPSAETARQNLGRDSLITLLSFALFFVQPAAIARLATTGSLASGLDVRAVLGAVRRNPGGYVLIVLVGVGASLLGLALTGILLWPVWVASGRSLSLDDLPLFITAGLTVGLILFAPYTRCVEHHLYGQAFLKATR